MPILAIAVTTIECDGHNGAACPNSASVEYARPKSVAIRLAQQSGWTVWIETMCPECSVAPTAVAAASPSTPAVLTADPEHSVVEDASGRCARMKAQISLVPVAV